MTVPSGAHVGPLFEQARTGYQMKGPGQGRLRPFGAWGVALGQELRRLPNASR